MPGLLNVMDHLSEDFLRAVIQPDGPLLQAAVSFAVTDYHKHPGRQPEL
jgi:hypothetical protein